MSDDHLLTKVHGLSDLELAALLCLMNREHCLVSTPSEALDELIEELQLISAKTFGLNYVVVDCHPQTTLDDFASAILVPQSPSTFRASSPFQSRPSNAPETSYFVTRPGALTPLAAASSIAGAGAGAEAGPGAGASPSPNAPGGSSAPSRIANVVIAKNLDQAPKPVQIQALELLRTRRIFTRTSVQPAPKQFLFVASLASASPGAARVTPHLNDIFYLAHWHDPDHGFANLEDAAYERSEVVGGEGSETGSMESVVKKASSNGDLVVSDDPVFTDVDIATLGKLGREVQVDVDVLRYQMNIVSFLRMHRAVGGGVSATATKHFEQLVKALAPLHGLDYATPALVALALKKTYLHRLKIVDPGHERSLQWGSQIEAVEALLEGIGPEEIMDDVLETVATPL